LLGFSSGGVLQAERISAPAPVTAKWTPGEGQLKEYEGDYPLSITFALRVFSTGPKLLVQGTNRAPTKGQSKPRLSRKTYSSRSP